MDISILGLNFTENAGRAKVGKVMTETVRLLSVFSALAKREQFKCTSLKVYAFLGFSRVDVRILCAQINCPISFNQLMAYSDSEMMTYSNFGESHLLLMEVGGRGGGFGRWEGLDEFINTQPRRKFGHSEDILKNNYYSFSSYVTTAIFEKLQQRISHQYLLFIPPT